MDTSTSTFFIFQYSAEVIKPHLLWHCESAELAEQFPLHRAPGLVSQKASSQKHHLHLSSGLQVLQSNPSVKDIAIVKALLSIPGETEKNVQIEIVIVSDKGEKQKRGNDTLL